MIHEFNLHCVYDRVADECEVRFYLYDAEKDAVFTECGLLELGNNATHNINQLKSTRFLFTVSSTLLMSLSSLHSLGLNKLIFLRLQDLSSDDIQRSRVYLIA